MDGLSTFQTQSPRHPISDCSLSLSGVALAESRWRRQRWELVVFSEEHILLQSLDKIRVDVISLLLLFILTVSIGAAICICKNRLLGLVAMGD
ncbi:hypothetical protein ASPWEDRAFT_311950 [Aspergillus wentii DTO 134E9]|uniref:Uncharacterized protein n=1 Tax=Aspergillus wentii DTO 134E9 TaxID=1073089 RepID=A0A1L9RTE4_ASPWE|nr:uncharacterized protein ASPWEDRAFT_311950 [Aspergillus wentii DTO 134E9]OJJ38153.1 hypothetical protein ASPWEDRAFT_311950 [Aspergillus wentii DTO 134E9]